jgi:hypothetical protein
MTAEEIHRIVERAFPCSMGCRAGPHARFCDAAWRDQGFDIALEVLKLVSRRILLDLAVVEKPKEPSS